jgi:hypothetical protein
MARWLEHIRVTSDEIGPRGSTTRAEARAAGYVRNVLADLGADPRIEVFSSAKSPWRPYTLVTLISLVGVALYPLDPPLTNWIAVLVAALAFVCGFVELNLMPNPIKWVLPKGESQIDAYVITLDNLGIAGPAWILHKGLNLQFYSDPDLIALAERIAAEHPGLGACPQKWDVAYTDSAPAIKAGLKTITLLGATRDKKLPYWHVPDDTVDKLRPEVLANTAEFAWRMVRAIDAGLEMES